MLRSWIERARRGVSPRASAGLVIGREHVSVVEIVNRENGPQVLRLAEAKLDVRIFNGKPTAAASTALARSFDNVAAGLKRRYLPVHVSLPDPVVRVAVLELDDLPKTRAAQMELARWRLAQDGNASEVCACQPLGEEGGKQFLFALAMDSAWHECVVAALNEAGIVAWSLSANTARLFNRFHERLVSNSGALISVSRDASALWIWDKRGRPRYVRARWHAEKDEYAAIVSEIERSILAYVHGGQHRDVSRVYVCADAADAAFVDVLNSRMREPAIPLAVDEGVAFEATVVNRNTTTLPSCLGAALDQ